VKSWIGFWSKATTLNVLWGQLPNRPILLKTEEKHGHFCNLFHGQIRCRRAVAKVFS